MAANGRILRSVYANALMPQRGITFPVDLTACGRFMLLAMKWLLFTVLSFQLVATPPCLAAMDCGMGPVQSAASPEAHHHSSVSADSSQHKSCDDCGETDSNKAVADNTTSATLCSGNSDLAFVAPEATGNQIAVMATVSDFPHAPPDTRATYPSPKPATLRGETTYLRTLRIRL